MVQHNVFIGYQKTLNCFGRCAIYKFIFAGVACDPYIIFIKIILLHFSYRHYIIQSMRMQLTIANVMQIEPFVMGHIFNIVFVFQMARTEMCLKSHERWKQFREQSFVDYRFPTS